MIDLTSENEAMNDSEWEFESDEEQATGSTLLGSGKLTWNDMIMRVDVTPILAFLNQGTPSSMLEQMFLRNVK